MAVGMTPLPVLYPVPGIRLGTAEASIRYRNRPDLGILEIAAGAQTAAMFTRNAFCAAPIQVARAHLASIPPRYLLINAGNANAGTGAQGLEDARACCQALAVRGGCSKEAVLPFSTGVIGEPLPVARIVDGIPAAFASLHPEGWEAAARAIMTTDTSPKGASCRVEHAGQRWTVTGIAKGAGMICPDMATMLAFVATDAALSPDLLRHCLEEAVNASFHCITIDGDTSTNDACVLIATGVAGGPLLADAQAEGYLALQAAVQEVCGQLAQAIVRDAEGSTKFVRIEVREGVSLKECRQVAYAIAHSPLVKTALYASDPNWGRILAAVGRAGLADLDVSRVEILLDEVCVVSAGARAPGYTETEGRRVMRQPEFQVRVKLGRGPASASLWTSDLSQEYVRINAEYRT
jgi:glutamate N-acetyltransferase/amino-acid N-acetyltransferase